MMNDQTPIDDAHATPVNATHQSKAPDFRPGFDAQATHSAIQSLNYAIAPPQPTPLTYIRSILAWNQDWLGLDTSAADEAHEAIRNHLDTPSQIDEEDCPRLRSSASGQYLLASIKLALAALNDDPYHRDELSHLAIELSLCPMHFCDWASCFDDDDDDCRAIRTIFPYGHDT